MISTKMLKSLLLTLICTLSACTTVDRGREINVYDKSALHYKYSSTLKVSKEAQESRTRKLYKDHQNGHTVSKMQHHIVSESLSPIKPAAKPATTTFKAAGKSTTTAVTAATSAAAKKSNNSAAGRTNSVTQNTSTKMSIKPAHITSTASKQAPATGKPAAKPATTTSKAAGKSTTTGTTTAVTAATSAATKKSNNSAAGKTNSGTQGTKSSFLLANPLNNKKFIWPINGTVIRNKNNFLEGTHILAPSGSLVKSAASGTVIYSGSEDEYFGNLIIIKHGTDYFTGYGHLSKILVNEGDSVARGEYIGKIGQTGQVTEPQLLFSMRHNKKLVDPEKPV